MSRYTVLKINHCKKTTTKSINKIYPISYIGVVPIFYLKILVNMVKWRHELLHRWNSSDASYFNSQMFNSADYKQWVDRGKRVK